MKKMRLFSDKRNVFGQSTSVCGLARLVLIGIMITRSSATVSPECNLEGTSSTTSAQNCNCSQTNSLSGTVVSIKCDFGNKEDVLLTEALYPFSRSRLVNAYVRIANATSVGITAGFWNSVQSVPSVALDIWRGGELTLDSSPQSGRQNFPSSYDTYMGIGIINCTILSIPEYLFRDRTTARLLIRGSKVGVIRQNSFFNIDKIKMLMIQESLVDWVEGPLSNRGAMALVPGSGGYGLFKTTIKSIASSAFNFICKRTGRNSNPCEMKVVKSRLGDLSSGAISALGAIDITIEGTHFQRLRKDALKVNVTGDLKFEENLVELLELGGLKSLLCMNFTSMEKNTIHMEAPMETPFNSSTVPFDASCGDPQVFIVMSPPQPRTLQTTSNATWVILSLLILFVIVIAFVGFQIWSKRAFLRQYRRGKAPMSFSERTTMRELHNSAEDDDDDEGVEEEIGDAEGETGVSNPIYGIKEPS